MNEKDVMELLAGANPVHVTDLAPLELPSPGHRPARGRAALEAAVVAAGIAASLIGLFAFGGAGSHTRTDAIQGPTGSTGPTGPEGPPGTTIARPLPSGKEVTLPEAAAVLDVALVLPDTTLVGPGNVGPVWADSLGPSRGVVAVTYPTQRLMIEYDRPPGNTDYSAMAKGDPRGRVIDLNGTPAFAFTPDDVEASLGSVMFSVGGTEVAVIGHQGEPTLESIARSILDRMGATPGTPGVIAPVYPAVDLSALSDELGKPVVLPRTSFVQPSDAEWAWTEGDCSRGPNWCRVTIWFPAHGLAVSYYQQGSSVTTRFDLERIAHHVRFGDGHVVDLNGVPALLIENQDGEGLGSIAFYWHGLGMEVDAYENAGVLTDLAQSMLDQLRGTSSGPFTASPGVDLFPIVEPSTQVDVSDASATLGAPVVLPDTAAVQPSDAASAWAEGQCPHPSVSSADGFSGCAVWVKFPAKSLTIVYERPGGSGTGIDPTQLKQESGAHVVDLGGVPALAIDRNAQGPNPGWLDFALNGTRVIISGDYDTPTLQAIAQSIVDRSK